MPLVRMWINPKVKDTFVGENGTLLLGFVITQLVGIVERTFGIEDEGDVEAQVIVPLLVFNGDDLEVEVSYTVGVGEYKEGVLFKPTKHQRISICDQINAYLKQELRGTKIRSTSVWVKPFSDTTYRRMKITPNA